jgi:predicted RNA-binding Zn-ribbon protein involved in translation (DUF1610 family)
LFVDSVLSNARNISQITESALKRWFFHDGERQHGPYSDNELLSQVASGKLCPEHDIRRTDHLDWVKATEVKGLFKTSSVAPQNAVASPESGKVKFTCPSCGKHLLAKSNHAGETHKCPACRSPVAIPTAGQSSGAAPIRTIDLSAPTRDSSLSAEAMAYEPMLIRSAPPAKRTSIPIGGLSLRKLFGSLVANSAEATAERPTKDAIVFYDAQSVVDLGRGPLRGPLVYATGQRFQCVHDASLIELPLAANARTPPERLPYWPSYHGCSIAQRSRYLDWLYGGKCDTNIEIGYVFLFFYGLERRILVDGQDHQAVVEELLRLLSIYPMSRSFLNYATSLLWLTIFLSSKHEGIPQSTVIRAFQNTTRWTGDALQFCLSYYFTQNLTLPVEVAYAVAGQDERSPSSIVARRNLDRFRDLFTTRFQQRFPSGFPLRSKNRDLPIKYRAGSASLLSSQDPLPQIRNQTLPDLSSRTQYVPLVEIWTACVDDLRKFDRAARQVVNNTMTAGMYEALPTELRTFDHPELDLWQKATTVSVDEGGWPVMPVYRLAEFKGFSSREHLTKSQCAAILATADALGMAIEPDARRTAKNYGWNEMVVVFRETGDIVSDDDWKPYHSAAILLQLGLAIAQADGHDAISRRLLECPSRGSLLLIEVSWITSCCDAVKPQFDGSVAL